MIKPIYLDNNATTLVDKEVAKAMQQEFENGPYNPSSVHFFGREAKSLLCKARALIANHFNVHETEVIFTSGGSEALNFLLRGLSLEGGHVITSNLEHSAVYKTLGLLKNIDITYLEGGSYGAVSPEAVKNAIKPHTKLIVLIGANNETGVMSDIGAIAQIAEQAHIPFIVDAVSWIGKELFTMHRGILAIAVSGHKFHGPKGSGFVILRKKLKCSPLITGGAQEYGKRAGTENLAAILGLAKAIELLKNQEEITQHIKKLRERFENALLALGNISINGRGKRISNTSNILFHGIDAETLLIHLDLLSIAVSHGSACSSGAIEPSRVLLNMGLSRKEAKSSIRFSLSRFTTEEEIDHTVAVLKELLKKL